jgi:hypothetical protein
LANATHHFGGGVNEAGVLIVVTTVLYIVLTVAVFALFGLVQKWVENL